MVSSPMTTISATTAPTSPNKKLLHAFFWLLVNSSLTATILKVTSPVTLVYLTPVFVALSAAIIHRVTPKEKSHFATHLVYLYASITKATIVYCKGPFKEVFDRLSKPCLALFVKITAWPVGLAAIIVIELLYYAFVRAFTEELGWYGVFHDRLISFEANAVASVVSFISVNGAFIRAVTCAAGGAVGYFMKNAGRAIEELFRGDGVPMETKAISESGMIEASCPPPYIMESAYADHRKPLGEIV